MSGANIRNKNDYDSMPEMMFYLQTFRNSIGNIDVLSYEFWDDTMIRLEGFSKFMIYLIQFIWFIQ